MDFYKNSEFANSLKISQELDLDLKCQHNWSNFIASKKSTSIISREYLDYPFFVSKAEYWINILTVKVFYGLKNKKVQDKVNSVDSAFIFLMI